MRVHKTVHIKRTRENSEFSIYIIYLLFINMCMITVTNQIFRFVYKSLFEIKDGGNDYLRIFFFALNGVFFCTKEVERGWILNNQALIICPCEYDGALDRDLIRT